MAAAGIANVSTWCYRAGEQMTAVRSEQAQLAWETVVATYRSLKAASSRRMTPVHGRASTSANISSGSVNQRTLPKPASWSVPAKPSLVNL